MCLCTPEIRTPYCGKPGCEWPEQKRIEAMPNSGPNESHGKLSEPLLCQFNCPKCKRHYRNTYQSWEPVGGSNPNPFTKHTCYSCGHVWWHEILDVNVGAD